MAHETWNVVIAASTLVGTVVVSVTAILAYLQLKEMTAARWVEAISKVFDMLINDEISKARRYVRTKDLPPPGTIEDEITNEDYQRMYKVWTSFDNLGIMIAFNMLPEHLPLEMFHTQVIECWEKLEPQIHFERQRRKGWYAHFFEDLYILCIEYRTKRQNNPPLKLRKTKEHES